jgi:hypothetical protein
MLGKQHPAIDTVPTVGCNCETWTHRNLSFEVRGVGWGVWALRAMSKGGCRGR